MAQGPTPYHMTEKEWLPGISADEHWAMNEVFAWHDVGDFYANVTFALSNENHFTEGPSEYVHWIDAWTPPQIIAGNRPNTDDWTSNEHDVYPTIDQIHINLRADQAMWDRGEAVVWVSLEHSMPNMARSLVRCDHEGWRETEPNFRWKLRSGKNEIMAKAVNAFGREGHSSRVLLRYHP